MTPAQSAKLVIGNEYTVTGGTEHSLKIGSVVTFCYDDGTAQPKFRCKPGDSQYDYESDYIYVDNIEPVVAGADVAVPDNLTIEDTTRYVQVEVTIITVERKLTQAERDAIAAIIDKGNAQ